MLTVESYHQKCLNRNSVFSLLLSALGKCGPHSSVSTRPTLLLPAMSLRDSPSLHHPIAGRLLTWKKKKKRLSQLFIPFMDSNYNLLHLCFVWPLGGGILMHSDLGGEPLLYVEGEPNSIWAPGGDILLHTGHRRRHPAAHRTGKRGPDACVHWEGAGHLFGPGHSVCPALVG